MERNSHVCFDTSMEVVSETNGALEACLKLLRGSKDEQKFAGLLMASKHLKPEVGRIHRDL